MVHRHNSSWNLASNNNTSNSETLKLYTIYSPPHHPRNQRDVNKPTKICQIESQNGGIKIQKSPSLYPSIVLIKINNITNTTINYIVDSYYVF